MQGSRLRRQPDGRLPPGGPENVAQTCRCPRPAAAPRQNPRAAALPDAAAAVEKLLRDLSLRSNERGKGMLRLLRVNAVGAEQLPDTAAAVPPYCVAIIVRLARQCARMRGFARGLDERAQIIDPSAATR